MKGCGFSACESCGSSSSFLVATSSRSSSSSSWLGRSPKAKRLSVRECLRACKFGDHCRDASSEHAARFAHPGDRGYRKGLVTFKGGEVPCLATLWLVFTFFDPNESGHLTREEFRLAEAAVASLASETWDSSAAWDAAGGNLHGHVSFVRFALWCGRVGVKLPVGLDMGGERQCRFQSDGCECECSSFRPRGRQRCCQCGHGPTAHRSDVAQQSIATQLLHSRPRNWKRGALGLISLSGAALSEFQFLVDVTHKENHNWTRDRGCAIHGVNRCSQSCACSTRAPVPSGYRVVCVLRNQNPKLWARYSLMRASIQQECRGGCRLTSTLSSEAPFHHLDDSLLMEGVNEWRLFHGTSETACKAICEQNFDLSMAGTGATWKKKNEKKGMPLYGQGIFFAERITKADEYATPMESPDGSTSLRCALLCRVLAGRLCVCTGDQIDPVSLRKQVLDGPNHAVLGDRVQSLGKPFREVVIYDSDQIYPEFMVIYAPVW